MNTADTDRTDWHRVDPGEAARLLDTDLHDGLDPRAIHGRRKRYGPNTIRHVRRRGMTRILAGQFRDFMILVLMVAAVISGMIGEPVDAVAILVIVVLNAAVGALQEYRAERTIAALGRMTAPEARVRRGDGYRTIPADELVPGDLVFINAGDVVPADLRLSESEELQVDEAVLTGESQAVEKSPETLEGSGLNAADITNMAFQGTHVTRGHASGLVVATGMATELGRIAGLLETAEILQTPLQQRLTYFGRRLAYAVLAICTVIFVVGLTRGTDMLLMFLTAVSLAVAAVPEALPAVVSVSLAVGAHKMGRRNALIRHLPAVETLGSVTYICADKTGTLTENRMHVERLYVDGRELAPAEARAQGHPPPRELLLAMAISNNVQPEPGGGAGGDPTEIALVSAAREAGMDREDAGQRLPRVAELPFDTERRRMTTLHRDGDGIAVFTKGAPEEVLPLCTRETAAGETRAVDVQALATQAETFAAQGYRVLAVAYRSLPSVPEPATPEVVEKELTLLALVGLMDPPRAAVPESVAECLTAGITPVMITGDHPDTARAIAVRLGIAQPGDEVVTGEQLRQLSEDDLEKRLRHARVFARVTPEQKIDIVSALQANGQFAAMTGDGVNDAPALKRADIGVAMGRKGTDVAREASDMVLLDDNFATIVAAVREGRRIFDNIRKFIKYTMTSNSGEIWTLFLAPFFGLPVPLLPIHILWINLVTDGLPGLALTAEPAERGIMTRPPRPPGESVFAHGMWQHMIWVGLLIAGVSLTAQAWAYHSGSAHWQTMVFTVLTFAQLVHVLVIRAERESLLTIGLLSNKMVLGAVIVTVVLQLAVIYTPALNTVFKTAPLAAEELGLCFALPLIVLVAVEAEKWLARKGRIYTS